MKSKKQVKKAPAKPPPREVLVETGWPVRIREVRIESGQMNFSDQFIQPNPTGMSLSKSFGGYGSNTKLRVYAYAIFQNGTMFDPRDMENDVTTK